MLLPILFSLTVASSTTGLPLRTAEPGPPPAGNPEHPLADPFTAGFRFCRDDRVSITAPGK